MLMKCNKRTVVVGISVINLIKEGNANVLVYLFKELQKFVVVDRSKWSMSLK